MTAQPDMPGFGKPPAAPTGFRKFAPFIASAATGGFIVMAGIYIMQIAAPQRYTPGGVAGDMAGSEQVAHLRASGDEQISYEVRSQAAQQALGVTTNAMQGAALIANSADALCGASRIGQNFAGKQRPVWDVHHSDAGWWEDLFRDLGSASCGVGAQVRNGIINEVTSNGRQSGTLSVRDPQAAPRPPQAQQAIYRTFDEVYAIDAPSHHYPWDDVMKARSYVRTLPKDVQDRLFANLDDHHAGWDVFTERVRAYAVVSSIQ